MRLILLLCCVVFAKNRIVFGVKLPSSIQLCHKSEPNFDKCVGDHMAEALTIFKDGNSELGIPKLDPFLIPKLEIAGEPGQPVTLSQKYENMLTYGISASDVIDAKYDLKDGKCYWSLVVLTPHCRMEADYEMHGQLLMFPINGHGKCVVKLTNLRNHHQAWCERYQKKGKTHLKLIKYTMEMDVKHATFNFSNIIPGNEQLSQQLSKTVNENSEAIFNDVKYGFETTWSSLHLQIANNVMSKIPENELFLD